MRKILCTLAIAAAFLAAPVAKATPVTDWVDGQKRILVNSMATAERSKTARCGMQIDKQAHFACYRVFEIARIYDEALKADLENISRLDKVENPALKKQLIEAAVTAYNDSAKAGTQRLRAIEEIFKQVISSARP